MLCSDLVRLAPTKSAQKSKLECRTFSLFEILAREKENIDFIKFNFSQLMRPNRTWKLRRRSWEKNQKVCATFLFLNKWKTRVWTKSVILVGNEFFIFKEKKGKKEKNEKKMKKRTNNKRKNEKTLFSSFFVLFCCCFFYIFCCIFSFVHFLSFFPFLTSI